MRQTNSLCIHKRILSVILALVVCLAAIPLSGYATDNIGTYALEAAEIFTQTGDGSEESPYLISTAEQLKKLADDSLLWDKHFRLTADIDLGGQANGSWSPIGNNTTKFTGTFDGGEHLISGLYINAPESDYQGLFGYVSGGVIINLGVDGSVTGQQYVGGIVGYLGLGYEKTSQ